MTTATKRRRRSRRQGIHDFVSLWAGLFKEHNVLTYASAVAFEALVALVAIVLLVGIELDEQLRKDLHGKNERGIIEIVRDVF